MFPSDFKKLKRTKRFAPEDSLRELPVDAMMLPFLTMGLGTAMTQGLVFGELIDAQQQGATYGTGLDFG